MYLCRLSEYSVEIIDITKALLVTAKLDLLCNEISFDMRNINAIEFDTDNNAICIRFNGSRKCSRISDYMLCTAKEVEKNINSLVNKLLKKLNII